MSTKSILMFQWMATATAPQKRELARRLRTSTTQLRHLASGYRRPSSSVAIDVEQETRAMNRKFPALPVVLRESLAFGCARCDVLKACRSTAQSEVAELAQ